MLRIYNIIVNQQTKMIMEVDTFGEGGAIASPAFFGFMGVAISLSMASKFPTILIWF